MNDYMESTVSRPVFCVATVNYLFKLNKDLLDRALNLEGESLMSLGSVSRATRKDVNVGRSVQQPKQNKYLASI